MLKEANKTKTAIVKWIKDYFQKYAPGASAVVGISGGKDSSVTAALCVEALGKERVIGVTMENGERTKPSSILHDIRTYVQRQLETEIWPEEQRFENPHHHFLDMSPAYYEMKMNLLKEAQGK